MQVFRPVLTLLVLTASLASSADIIYKEVGTYDLIWKDSGSGAKEDVSFWRPANNEYGFYLLGDVAVNSHGEPQQKYALAVKALKASALVKPTSYTLLWNDRGSGAYGDVTLYRMNAPPGYTCLGDIAVNSYSKIMVRQYRCVQNQYLIEGEIFTG